MLDRHLVPLLGAFGWPLQCPVERAQQAPDVPRVILHARQLLDDPSDPGQRPEVRAEAMRPWALAQGRFDAPHLLRSQPWLAPGAARAPQRPAPALAPRAIPSHDALAADAQASGDGTARLSPRAKQPRGLVPTNFQSVEIPSWCHMSGHAFHRTMGRREASLYYARFSRLAGCAIVPLAPYVYAPPPPRPRFTYGDPAYPAYPYGSAPRYYDRGRW